MIANFFQNLNDRQVDYLLISGQATVLYGAATFSEDIDLWIKPTLENLECFLSSLRASQARYYKLTPPLQLEYLLRGHGFHFILPAEMKPPVFLDVMGKPPRVGSFESAQGAARWIDTDWGRVLTIGIKELIELKKTQRLEDYAVISRLVLAWFEQPGVTMRKADCSWAFENVFTLPELRLLFESYPGAANSLPTQAPDVLKEFAETMISESEVPEEIETELGKWMQDRVQLFQHADRLYWRPILHDLRELRAGGKIMTEGTTV